MLVCVAVAFVLVSREEGWQGKDSGSDLEWKHLIEMTHFDTSIDESKTYLKVAVCSN